MLTIKDDLTVEELKRFLRLHIREKSITELFQELSNAKQQDKETPQQFMYRLMGLKQHLLVASQQYGSEFNYDKKLVQVAFLHSLYQGVDEKNTNIRSDLKPYITDSQVTENLLFDQVTRSRSILALTAQVPALTKHLEKISKTPDDSYQTPTRQHKMPGADTKGRWHECVYQCNTNCSHCFRCGQEGHRAMGCLKNKRQGKGEGSLGRGSQ